ncbi:MAG: PAS domain S-box protein [Bacteroidales bacterium]|nr:PAS domain S-box protein [Bacteroidales bacterium]
MKNANIWKAWLALIISMIVTLLATIYVKDAIDKKDEAEFRFECKEIASKIEIRLHAHAQLLRSGAAFFGASDTVSREHWKIFIEQSKVDLNLPGIQGVGFSLLIPKEELAAHIQQIRNEGYPDYKVWPEGDREIYTSIIYLEPFEGPNLRAFGYDLMTEPNRRSALERARDMDMASLTNKILLVQESGADAQAATIMYVAVYQKGKSLNSIEERRRSIIGWVSSPYRMDDLISGILSNWELEDNRHTFYLHIYDGFNYSSESLLYESHKAEDQEESEKIRFELDLPIDFNGHRWMLVFTEKKESSLIDYAGSWGALMRGCIISILLFFLTRSLINTRYNAQKIAETLTVELKESERLLKESQEIARLGSYSLDLKTGIWKSSKILDAIFGIDENFTHSIEGWTSLIHPDYTEQLTNYLNQLILEKKFFDKEYKIIRNNDKEERWVHGLGKLEFDSKNTPKTLVGTIIDITEQKLAVERLQLSREQYRSLFENSPIGIYQTTPDGKIINANPTLLKMLEFDSLSELQKRDLEKEGYSKDSSITRHDFVELINKEGYVKGLEENWLTKSGRAIPIRENARIVRGSDDSILYYEGTVEDITERKEAEMKIQSISNRLQLATSAANIGIWELGVTDNSLIWDDAMYSLYGILPETFSGAYEAWEAGLHPDDLERGREEIKMALRGEKEFDTEFRVLWPDKSVHHIKATGFVSRDKSGNAIRMYGTNIDVTSQKLSEEEVKRLNIQNQLILDSIGEGIYGLDLEGNMTFANPATALMIGKSVEELIGMQGHDDHHHTRADGSPYPREECPIYSAFRTGVTSHVDNEVFWRKDGTSFPVEYTSTPIRNESGNLIGSVVVFKDITQRKQVEKELKESENRLRTIIEVSPVPIVLTKINDGVVIMANERLGKLFKISVTEAIGQKSPDYYHNIKDRDSLLKAVMVDGYVDNYEIVLKKSDGELFWCSVSLKLMSLDNEQVLIAGFHDITERKNAEEEIMKHRENLEEMVAERTRELTISEQKLQQSVKDISDYKLALDESSIVSITDHKGIIKHVNNNFCKVSKFRREELIGNSHKIINSGFHPKDFFINLWSTIAKGEVWRGELKNRAKDGTYFWLDSTIVPFVDEKGKPYQYVAVRFDITDKKLSEEDLIKAKDAADSANRAKSEFLANMSHEIRTPMNAVIGFSELLSKSVQDDKQGSQVEAIRSSGKNLLKIINDILDLSKIEAGKIEIIPTPVNLLTVLDEIENMFTQKVKEKGIIFSIEYDKVLTKNLLMDEVRFRQILFNLIGNAVKFTDKGYVSLSIEKSNTSKDEQNLDLIITVQDTGIGIPVDQQELIFDPFSQQSGQSALKYGGTGLGLSITKKLVEKMGGSIRLESEAGKGSTFRIFLPGIKVLDTDIEELQKTFDTSAVLFEPSTVLVVDDVEENRKLIIDLLENSPITFLEAVNGEEAVDLAKEFRPDLILMDLRMPIMDGYEAVKILKKEKLTKSIPVLAITASIKSTKERDRIKKVFDEYLLKPIDIEQLFDWMKKHLKYKLAESVGGTDISFTGKPEYRLSEEQKRKIPAFIKTLELQFIPEYEKIIKKQVINEIEKFGLNLLVISEKMDCQILIDYSNEIMMYAENFEFTKLIQTLKRFPERVDWLKYEIK